MPIYEYQCGGCGHLLEAFQGVNDKPLKTCPKCHQSTLNKLISSTSFQLKGTGWYQTDYSNKNKAPATADKPKEDGVNTSSGSENSKSMETKSADSKPKDSSSNEKSTQKTETKSASSKKDEKKAAEK